LHSAHDFSSPFLAREREAFISDLLIKQELRLYGVQTLKDRANLLEFTKELAVDCLELLVKSLFESSFKITPCFL
jgi:hypothetical protein